MNVVVVPLTVPIGVLASPSDKVPR